MIIKNVSIIPYSSKSILLSKYKYSMIKMYAEDLEPPIINLQQGLNLSSAPCQCDSIRDGIKFNSISQISPEEHMEAII